MRSTIVITILGLAAQLAAEEPKLPRGVYEPIHRVAKNKTMASASTATSASASALIPTRQPGEHPLDPALRWAAEGLGEMRRNVNDYTCRLVKRETVNGKLSEHQYIFAKIRQRKSEHDQVVVPFSVYLSFLGPDSVKGQEVLFVEGRNGGKLIAHKGGVGGKLLPTVHLDPSGSMAMKGNRYPITEIGIENLLVKLIEKGERDRKQDECQVEFLQGAKVNDRACTVLQVTHPTRRPHFDFHIARIFVDEQLRLPVRYASYTWPATPGAEPPLIEEYTYLDLKINVGLTDIDFDAKNKAYRF